MSAFINANNPHTVAVSLGNVAGGQSEEIVGFVSPKNAIIQKAYISNQNAIAKDGSNKIVVTLKDHTTGATIGTFDSSTAPTALGALEGQPIPLTATPSDAEAEPTDTILDKGHTLTISASSTGTATLSGAVVTVLLSYL